MKGDCVPSAGLKPTPPSLSPLDSEGGSAFKKDAVAAGFLSEVGASYEYDAQLMHHLRPILVGFTLDRRMRGGGSGWEFGRVWFMALVLKTSTSKKSREFKSHSSRKK